MGHFGWTIQSNYVLVLPVVTGDPQQPAALPVLVAPVVAPVVAPAAPAAPAAPPAAAAAAPAAPVAPVAGAAGAAPALQIADDPRDWAGAPPLTQSQLMSAARVAQGSLRQR